MEPVYVKKADPKDQTTWLDTFIALEPTGGVREVVATAQHHRARAVFLAVLGVVSERTRSAA
jgi:hypothetical protein